VPERSWHRGEGGATLRAVVVGQVLACLLVAGALSAAALGMVVVWHHWRGGFLLMLWGVAVTAGGRWLAKASWAHGWTRCGQRRSPLPRVDWKAFDRARAEWDRAAASQRPADDAA